jgi:hypothetical protein
MVKNAQIGSAHRGLQENDQKRSKKISIKKQEAAIGGALLFAGVFWWFNIPYWWLWLFVAAGLLLIFTILEFIKKK